MNENHNIKLFETVVLVDAAFLNFSVTDMKKHFEWHLKRSLSEIDLSVLTTYLALDAGVKKGKNEIQFLFIYDEDSSHLACCHPSDLEKELNGVAFQNAYGEFIFSTVPSGGMVSRELLFLDLLSIVAESTEVKKMIVLSFNEEYGDKVTTVLNEVKDKEIIQFRMDALETPVNYKWDVLAFPVMQAFGIRADEL